MYLISFELTATTPTHSNTPHPALQHVAVLLSGTLAGPVLLITVSCCSLAHLQMLHPRLSGLQALQRRFR